MMEERQASRRSLTRETSKIGNNFQISMYTKTIIHWEENVFNKTLSSNCSDEIKAKFFAKKCLLDELQLKKYLRLDEAFEEYLGMLMSEYHPNDPVHSSSLKSFVDSILAPRSGLPVLIINIDSADRYLMLLEQNDCIIDCLRTVDKILTENKQEKQNSPGYPDIDKVAGHMNSLVKLMCSTKEHAIVVCILSLLFPATTLRNKFNISEDYVKKFKDIILQHACSVDSIEGGFQESAKVDFEQTVVRLEESLKLKEESLQRQTNLHEIELENRKQDVENIKSNLQNKRLKERKKIKQIAARKLKKWKENLLRQTGKGQGDFDIDRAAEMADFNALQDQMVAHSRRKGKPEIEQRLQRKELRFIANKFLKQKGKKLIRSYETVRSWAMPRNKRSIQSKQHRGQSLYRHRKPQKKFAEEHINIHYNRAHIKNYTRFLFSKENAQKYKHFSVRRCIDDKAYLRCGTSEGFGRPANTPLSPVDMNVTIPAYDFPEKVGYIAPGVNLIINDMEEIESAVNKRSKFALTSATISVACKPKMYYASTPTNWANDLYSDRIEYPQEHEIPESRTPNIEKNTISALILAKDSLRQFSLMTLEADYLKCTDGNQHCEREKLRLSVIIVRLLNAYIYMVHEGQFVTLTEELLDCIEKSQYLDAYISSGKIEKSGLIRLFEELVSVFKCLESMLAGIVPQHRPIDIQTSDAGPGVGTSERMVRLRLVEHFLINDLDLQARMHYAPRDSKSHKVEQVMSHLTDAAGDGRHIWPSDISLFDEYSPEQVINMSKEDQNMYKQKRMKEIASDCAKLVAGRYEGKPAMKTTIHAKVPDVNNLYQCFFFDENYMKKCIATSKRNSHMCPGLAYFEFLEHKISELYIKYDNGTEAIRNDGNFRCPFEVKRIPPPVPDLTVIEENGSWHYHTPETLPDSYRDVKSRTIDDFCPRGQLNALFDSIGPVDILEKECSDNSILLLDGNHVWEKLQKELPKFVESVTGEDLENCVRKEAEKIYLRRLQKEQKKVSAANRKRLIDDYQSFMKDGIKIKITKKKKCLPNALPWNGSYLDKELTNTCTADNSLYFFHVKQTMDEQFRTHLSSSSHECFKVLSKIHHLFSQEKYAEGKYNWFECLNEFPVENQLWNAYGSEDQFFFKQLWPLTTTAYTSTCSNEQCSHPVSVVQSRALSYRYPEAGAVSFEDGFHKWMINSDGATCRKLIKGTSNTCKFMRTYSERQFVYGTPLALPIEISDCPWTSLPEQLSVNNIRYEIGFITMGNGGHFVANLFHNSQWYSYDGLKEYHEKGTGVKKSHNLVPPGYRRNYVIYSRLL